MGFSMGVYGDLMGIFMGSFMGFTGREIYIFSGWWLTYPSDKNMTSSVGITIPNIWTNKIHVPNQQPAMFHYSKNLKD